MQFVINELYQSILYADLGWNGGGRTGVDNTGTGLGLLAVREEQLEGGDDAAVGHLAGVLHHVHPELEDVTGADLPRW